MDLILKYEILNNYFGISAICITNETKTPEERHRKM